MSFLDEGDRDPYNPRKNITIGVILVMIFGGGALLWYYHDVLFAPGGGSARLERELEMEARIVNERTPMRVDEVTTLTGVSARGTTLTSQYTVSQDIPSERIEAARQALQQEIGTRLCADPNTAGLVRRGATIEADYRDPSGDHIRLSFNSCPGAPR